MKNYGEINFMKHSRQKDGSIRAVAKKNKLIQKIVMTFERFSAVFNPNFNLKECRKLLHQLGIKGEQGIKYLTTDIAHERAAAEYATSMTCLRILTQQPDISMQFAGLNHKELNKTQKEFICSWNKIIRAHMEKLINKCLTCTSSEKNEYKRHCTKMFFRNMCDDLFLLIENTRDTINTPIALIHLAEKIWHGFSRKYKKETSKLCRIYGRAPKQPLKFAKQFIDHLDGKDDIGLGKMHDSNYKKFLAEQHSSRVFFSSPFGPVNTLTPAVLKKLISKIRLFKKPPKPKPVPKEAPLTEYEQILKKKIDAGEKSYLKTFEDRRKITNKEWSENEEKSRQLTETDMIADVLGTTCGTVRNDKRRLKRWKML
jgi:hypothetical protein